MSAIEPSTASPPATRSGRPPFFWLVLALGLLLAAVFGAGTLVLARHGGERGRRGWEASPTAAGLVVRAVDRHGPAAGRLRAGDRVVAVNGDTRVSDLSLEWLLLPVPPGGEYTLRVALPDGEREVALTAGSQQAPRWRGTFAVRLLVALVLCSTGLAVGLLRPREKVARLYSLSALLSAPVFFANPLLLDLLWSGVLGVPEALVVWLARIHSPFHGAVGFHFAAEFPGGAAPSRACRRWRWTFYAWAALICAFYNLGYYFAILDPGAGVAFTWRHAALWRALFNLDALFGPAIFAAIPAVIIRNARARESPDRRRRLGWALFGAVVGFLPLLALFSVRFLDEVVFPGANLLPHSRRVLAENVALLFLAAAPVTLAYAIVKHRVFGIEIVIRRGLRHLLAKNVLRVALFAPAALLAASLIANPHRTLAQILFAHPGQFLLIAASALSLRYRGRLTHWIDRRFFRDAYHREQVLVSLIEDIRARDSLSELSRLVSDRLAAALHPQRVALVYRSLESGEFGVQYSSHGDSAGLRLPESGGLIRLAEERRATVELPRGEEGLTPDEWEWIRHLQVRVAVPMLTPEGRLVGLILLGEKMSEEPYTREDRALLEAMGAQIAIVYENATLKRRVEEEERVRREVLDRLEGAQFNLVRQCPRCGTCHDRADEFCRRDGVPLVLSLPMERTIAGKYRLERAIGGGGMGSVYEATDLRLARPVAVKVMPARSFGDRTALRRFEREAQASARLRHPNIVTIHDYGPLQAEGAYLVMELLTGTTLRDEIDQRGAIAPETAASWFDQMLEGIAAAHAAGVIHRDLKPENVFVTRDGRGELIKILDFGLAKLRLGERADPKSLTLPGTVLGTLSYMSPEQLSGHQVDERTDVFSIGVLAVEALTGRHPFAGPNSTAMVASILQRPFRLEGDSPAVRRLDAVLQRCLAKDRWERCASIEEIRRELVPAMRACPPFPSAPRSVWERDTIADGVRKGTAES
jgi:eukaryotic-like serine/threonine-protein kinase